VNCRVLSFEMQVASFPAVMNRGQIVQECDATMLNGNTMSGSL
jgi:hypothetical protein